MLFKTHLVFGIFLYFVLYSYIDAKLIFLFGLLFGVLIVDFDSKKSRVGNYFLFRPIQFFLKHRGFFHSLFFGFILMVIFSVFNTDLAFGFIVGFCSHLFLDMLTPKGIVPFYPLFKKRFGFGIKTGGIIEDVFFVLFLILDFVLLFYTFF